MSVFVYGHSLEEILCCHLVVKTRRLTVFKLQTKFQSIS